MQSASEVSRLGEVVQVLAVGWAEERGLERTEVEQQIADAEEVEVEEAE